MNDFLFQTGVQAPVIVLLWVLVSRDATRLRDRLGSTPAGISPFAWGALCGLTWIALIPYLIRRSKVAGAAPPIRERNLLRWFIVLAVAAGVSVAYNAAQGDANNAAQHTILAGTFVVCALVAWSRDRAVQAAHPHPHEAGFAASDDRR